jgi:hypothetical protein
VTEIQIDIELLPPAGVDAPPLPFAAAIEHAAELERIAGEGSSPTLILRDYRGGVGAQEHNTDADPGGIGSRDQGRGRTRGEGPAE